MDAMMEFSELDRDLAVREPSEALEQLERLERFSAAVDEETQKTISTSFARPSKSQRKFPSSSDFSNWPEK